MDGSGRTTDRSGHAGRKSNRTIGIILAGLAVLALAGFVYFQTNWHVYSIPSGAMEPTLRIGDNVLTGKGRFTASQIGRGDIIVFLTDGETPYVQRVIGKAGDEVRVLGGIVIVNGAAIPRQRIDDYEQTDYSGQHYRAKRYVETNADGRSYEVLDLLDDSLVDNTTNFAVPAGHLFAMGDNRDNSRDSRLDIGYVPLDRVVAIAERIIWSPKRDNPLQHLPLR